MQKPFFLERGVDLGRFHEGTLNLSIEPLRYTIGKPAHTFCEVKWSPDLPAEDFSFFDCRLSKKNGDEVMEGLVYFPHPETKPEFYQDPSTLEILAPFVPGVETGKRLHIQLKRSQMVVT